MKIATYNINGINSRLSALLGWLDDASPDIVCLQELKAASAEFPVDALHKAGYGAVWQGQKSWNGVAILAKGADPIEIRRGLPGNENDTHSRYIEAAVKGLIVGCVYLPNGNPQPGPKFEYKLAWFEHFIRHSTSLYRTGHPVVIAGDFNVVPTDFDIYNTRSWKKNALLQPESREAFRRLLAVGWADALRRKHPKDAVYTFWDYFRNHWQTNSGLRIDHVLLSATLSPHLLKAEVDTWVRGEPHASDHAPVWVEVRRPRTVAALKRVSKGVRKKKSRRQKGAG